MEQENRLIGKKLIHFDVIDSTNEYAKKNFINLENGTVILSDEQTKGKGRAGRGFISNKGGLYFSVIYHSELENSKLPLYTQLTSIAVFKALEELGIKAHIKWPNDLYINGYKVCGILTELIQFKDFNGVVIGIGININNSREEFMKANILASSIEEETKVKIDRKLFLDRILCHLDAIFLDFDMNIDFQKYRALLIDNSMIIGKEIVLDTGNENVIAKACDIDKYGNLIIDVNGERRTLNSGVVHIRM